MECNHKSLDSYYTSTSLATGIPGSIYSTVLRGELYGSGNRVVSPENQYFYNLVLTAHGLVMVFYLVMPVLYGGLGNYMVPVYQGAGEVGFPRANGLSLLVLVPVSVSYTGVALGGEFPGGTGWTLYPPLSLSLGAPIQVYTTIVALVYNGTSSFLGSLNYYCTIGSIRCPGLGLGIQYLFPVSVTLVLLILLGVLPVLTGALGALVSDTCYNTVYMDPAFGGDPVLYQHFFWYFGHPEVYILIVPGFGVLSQVVSGVSGGILVYGGQSMVLAMGCISVLGSLVWGHHIYTLGLEPDTRGYYTGITVAIALPTGTKLVNWVYTLAGDITRNSLSPGYLYTVLVLVMLTGGGSTGIVLGNAAVDVSLHDTYYVIAHFHLILSLGAMVSILVGVLYSQEAMVWGYPPLVSPVSVYYYTGVSLGVTLTFLPLHLLGYNTQPRRTPESPDSYNCWSTLSSLGSGLTVVSLVVMPVYPPIVRVTPYRLLLNSYCI
ncbi:MAG: cbb3-type cytochrome c oxidase subunit I, partial [Pseudomonadales bacterium]|nr:cbb3-type cytochrome c oxidase subunit I [Pseudomonadales bacterium]